MKKLLTLDVIFVAILLVISIPIILPYFHAGYFPTHDGEWAVVRLSEMYRELRDFQIPPRFSGVLNFEYGYPLFNFAYPFPYYLGIVLKLLQFDFVTSIKLLFAFSVPISAIFMYLASRQLWKNSWSALVSAILYIYLPYRFVDLYVRGSIGESLSFVIFPILFYLSLLINEFPKKKLYVVLLSFVYASLIMTHNIMAVLFTVPFLLLLLAISYINRKAFLKLLFAFFMGGLLSSFFTIPALLEKHNILLSKIPIADRSLYFVRPDQLIVPTWGYGVPTDLKDAFSYQIGWPQVVLFGLLIISFIITAYTRTSVKKEFSFRVGVALTTLTIVFITLMFSPTLYIWKSIPLLSEINYPWTLLAPIGFLIALLTGYIASLDKNRRYLAISLAICSVIFFLPYAKPQEYVNRGETFYSTNEGTTTSSSELMPLWVKNFPNQAPKQKVEFISGKGEVNNIMVKSNKVSFFVTAQNDSTLRINTIYYPGWNAFVNNSETSIQYDNTYGVMDVKVNKGESSIVLQFQETPLRLAADIISIITFIILIAYLFISKKNSKKI